MKYHSQSHTRIPALKNELLNSLLNFSSENVLLYRQTQIWFGLPMQSLCSKDDNVSTSAAFGEIGVSAHAFLAFLGHN